MPLGLARGTAGERIELELLDGLLGAGLGDDLALDATLLGPTGREPLQQDPALGRIGALLGATGEHVLSLRLAGP